MKRFFAVSVSAVLGAAVLGGCSKQSRGNADAEGESRARSPQEGANSSTAGSAGEAKNFGDTARSGASDTVTPPEAPKANSGTQANQPARQPQKSTEAQVETPPQR